MKDTRSEIELSIRSALLAKQALELLDVKDKKVAMLMLKRLAVTLVETTNWLETRAA